MAELNAELRDLSYRFFRDYDEPYVGRALTLVR